MEDAQVPDSFNMTLTEFCTQLSATDRRVEMIGAFEHVEKLAGNINDSFDAFMSRYKEFCNKPM